MGKAVRPGMAGFVAPHGMVYPRLLSKKLRELQLLACQVGSEQRGERARAL